MTRIKWSWRRVLPYAVGGLAGAVWILLVKAGFASANDCIEYVKSMKNLVGAPKGVLEDCMRTGWVQGTITSIIAAIGGGAIAVGVGTALTQPGDEKKPEDDPKPGGRPDPCQGSQNNYNQAKLHQDVLFGANQQWTNTLNQLEEMYWQVNKSGYSSASIDVAMLAGSVWGKAASSALKSAEALEQAAKWGLEAAAKGAAKEYLADSVKAKLFEAGMKSFLKGSLKDFDGYMSKVFGKQFDDVLKKAMQEGLKAAFMNTFAQEYDAGGGSFMGRSTALATFEKEWVGASLDFAGNLMSLGSMGSSAWSAAQKLEAIRGMMHDARQKMFESQAKLEEANFEMERARDDLQYCHNGDEYQKYLRNIEFSKLRSQG